MGDEHAQAPSGEESAAPAGDVEVSGEESTAPAGDVKVSGEESAAPAGDVEVAPASTEAEPEAAASSAEQAAAEEAEAAGSALAEVEADAEVNAPKPGAEKVSEELALEPAEEAPKVPPPTTEEKHMEEPPLIAEPDLDSRDSMIEMVTEALSQAPLFEMVSADFIKAVAERAEYRAFPPGKQLEERDSLETTSMLYVVAKGALRLRVGPRSMETKIVGPGTVLNGVGFLSLGSEAATYRPRRADEGAIVRRVAKGYDVEGFERKKHVPQGYKELVHIGHPPANGEKVPEHSSDHLTFFGTFPYSTVTGADGALNDFLELSIQGAEPGEAPVEKKSSEFLKGGAVVAIIPSLKDISEIRKPSNGSSPARNWTDFPFDHDGLEAIVDCIHQRSEKLVEVWKSLMVRFTGTILPGVPPEVVWALTECAEVFNVPSGEVVIHEGEDDELADALVVIHEGVAMVERKTPPKKILSIPAEGLQDKDVKHVGAEVIGRLRSGAIIGDLCQMYAAVPRGATVRAKTSVEAVRIHSKSLMQVLSRFPGSVAGCESRLRDAGDYFEQRRPTRAEIVNSLALFSGCDIAFISDIAQAGNRRTMLCGEPIMEEGSVGGALHVLEHGLCAVEITGVGQVAQVPAGNCFGERTLLGIAPSANATIRVITPFVVVLSIAKQVLEDTLQLHPTEIEHFECMKAAPMEGRIAGSKVRNVELFRACSPEFLTDISKVVKTKGYMPGQAIYVEGEEDEDPRMLVLTGGRLISERDGQEVGTMEPGFTVGELALLGVVERRTVTVRAATYCYMMEIVRSAFDEVVNSHPMEAEYFRETLTPSTVQQNQNVKVTWPFLHGVPQKMHHLMDLYAERRKCEAGDMILSEEPVRLAAVLLLEGSATLIDAETGKEVETLAAGMCFNEQILAGICDRSDVKMVPTSACEVRVLSREKLQKVLAEFPQFKRNVKDAILRFMVEQAETKLGHKPGSEGALCASSSFCRSSSPAFAKKIRSILEPRLYEPGSVITSHRSEETDMYVLLKGVAHAETSYSHHELPVGSSFGEPRVLGIAAHYPGTLTATTLCTVQVLRRQLLDEAFKQFETERGLLTAVQDEAGYISDARVRKMLQHGDHFKRMHQDFVRSLCQGAEVAFFGPGSDVTTLGEPCELGKTCFYMLLAGKVYLGGPLSTIFGTVRVGGTFGEVGAFALVDARRASSHTWEEGLMACIKFQGPAIARAVKEHPQFMPAFTESCQAQLEWNVQVVSERKRWVEDVAVPALEKTPLFVGCSREFVHAVAVTTREYECSAGELLAVAGETTNYMMVVLSGAAELEAGPKTTKSGRLGKGAVFGEITALGLFHSWMSSLRAITHCTILKVTDAALKEAASRPGSEDIRDGLQRLVARRRMQVNKGLPLSALPYIGVEATDPCVRAVALMSECVRLQEGELWAPIRDDDPCGPYFTVILRGRVTVEVSMDHHAVMVLTPGSLLPEGLVAEYGAHLRADTACEAYRIRQTDFNVAIHSNASTERWIWRYRLQEKGVYDHLRARLESVHGLVKSIMPHSRDEEIADFTIRQRQKSSRALSIRTERAGSKQNLPGLHDMPPESMTIPHALASKNSGTLGRSRAGTPSKLKQDEKTGNALLELPQIAPVSRGKVGGSMMRSGSEPATQRSSPNLTARSGKPTRGSTSKLHVKDAYGARAHGQATLEQFA